MLDEPPLIVRTRGLAGFMERLFVIPQSGGTQFRTQCRLGLKEMAL